MGLCANIVKRKTVFPFARCSLGIKSLTSLSRYDRLQIFLFLLEQDCFSADRGDFKKLLRFSLFCFHAGMMTGN